MRNLDRIVLALALLLLSSVFSIGSNATARTYEECRALAISRGVPARFTTNKVERKYLLYKSAGATTHPKGLLARWMAGLD
jgi:hypothetical protein